MPRRVVPAAMPPFAFSSRSSIVLCHGITRCARSLIRRLSTEYPRARRASSSSTSCPGSTTTPLPITFSTPRRMIPLGRRRKANCSSPTCTVWPAFAPPLNRTTRSDSSARTSTILPLPSSPNCGPTTAVPGMFSSDPTNQAILNLLRAVFTVPSEFLAERLRCPFRRDGDDNPREAADVRSKERLRPPPVPLPALAQPRANGALDPEFLVVQEGAEESERPVEFPRQDPVVERVHGHAASPRVPGLRPPLEVAKPCRPRARHPRDRSVPDEVAQAPADAFVDE